MTSAARSVRRARGAATSGSCVVKVLRLQAPSRHCQRWRRSFTVTGAPCAGKSCRWRSCQPYRRVDRFPQSGQTPVPVATAEISHWPSPCSTSKIRMPCPRDQLDVLSTRLSYGFPSDRSRPQQKVRKNRIPLVRVCEGWGRQRPHLLGDDPLMHDEVEIVVIFRCGSRSAPLRRLKGCAALLEPLTFGAVSEIPHDR